MKVLSYIISLIFLWSTGAMAFAPGFLQVAGGGGAVAASCSVDNDTAIVAYENTVNDSYSWTAWESRQVTFASNVQATGVFWNVGQTATEVTIYGEIWTDNSGSPGTLVTGASGSAYPIDGTRTDHYMMFPSAVTISAGTYWVVMKPSGEVRYGKDTSGTGTYKYSSNSGTSWGTGDKQLIGVMGCTL